MYTVTYDTVISVQRQHRQAAAERRQVAEAKRSRRSPRPSVTDTAVHQPVSAFPARISPAE